MARSELNTILDKLYSGEAVYVVERVKCATCGNLTWGEKYCSEECSDA